MAEPQPQPADGHSRSHSVSFTPPLVTIHMGADEMDTAVELTRVTYPPNKAAGASVAGAASALPAYGSSDGARLPPVQVSYSDLKFSIDIKQGKVIEDRKILKGCSGTFNPGKLTAVMGASGAGKTSLLNLVSGNPTAGRRSGKICINGIDVFDSMNRIRELSAYIQQDDVLLGTQTVREAVTLSARLRLPKSMPDSDKLRRVEDVIEMLGLTKCADTIIGDAFNKGISGGEKRRTSLDTYTAHSIVALLRDIAHSQGKTVVCTIHQPSSDIFHMFDDLVLIADGQIMYHGPAEHTVAYFDQRGLPCPAEFNPADHLFFQVLYSMHDQLDMISSDMAASKHRMENSLSGASPDRDAASKAAYDAMQVKEKERVASLLDSWLTSPECATLHQSVSHPLTSPLPDPTAMRAERPGELYAFRLLSQRRWWDLLRDRMKIRMQFSQYIMFSILIGLIFLQLGSDQNSVQDRKGSLFFVCVQALFMSFMSNLNTFGPEKRVMLREMEAGMYGLPSYFFSRWIIELPFRFLFPFIYSCILYFMVGFQNNGERFILFAVTLMLLDNIGTNMAIMICSVFPDVQTAMQAGPAFIMPLMIFSGFYVNLGELGWWFRWISYISPVRWGFTAVIKNELEGLTFDCELGGTCIPTGEEAIRLLDMQDDPSVGANIGILIGLLAGFLLGAFAFMWQMTRRK